MNYYGNNNYRSKYNESTFSPSLSNVYNELMSSNRGNYNYNYPQNTLNRSSSNIKLNYHFLNRNLNSNITPYKSNSPQPNNIINRYSGNSYQNTIDKYNPNLNRSSNNIFSYRNSSNNNLSNYNNNYEPKKETLNDINNRSDIKPNFYDTLAGFERRENKFMNNSSFPNYGKDKEINKTNYKLNFKRDNSENRANMVYKNYFNNNNNINNISNNNYRNIKEPEPERTPYRIRRSPERNGILKEMNVENYKYISPNNEENYLNKMNRGYSYKNIQNRNSNINNINNINNNLNYNKKYKVADYGYSTMAGTNAYFIPKTNQDSYLIKAEKVNSNDIEYTFGVFDGHGLQGHYVSQAIKQFFMNCSYFDFNTQPMILSVFSSLSSSINNSKYFDSVDSGSTVILVHINSKKIVAINCGDSRAILVTKRNSNSSNYLNKRNNYVIELSRDHKPDIPEEKLRIEQNGGRVDKIFGMGPYRVWFKNEDFPGLAMSRSIGDRLAHRVGVSDIPEIKEFNIEENTPLAVVLASDGVWEFMSNEEVSEIIYRFEDNKDANLCAKKIVERARQIWEKSGYAIDDITCVVVFFKEN